jgi:cobalt-zinc-cadmium efflux system outer membrane protein
MFRSIILSFFLVVSLYAEPALVLSESTLSSRIQAQNPELKAARWRIQEALGRLNQAGRPSRPKLDVEWEQDARMRETEWRMGVSRSFPVTDRLLSEKAIGKKELEAAEREVRAFEQELLGQALESFVQALALKSRRELLGKQQVEAKEFADSLQQNQQRAEASAIDAAQAKLDAASLLIEQRQLDATEKTIFAELKKLLGMRPDDHIAVSGVLPALQAPQQGNISRRGDYLQALSEVSVAQAEVRHAQSLRYDDLDAGIFVSGARREDAPNGYERDTMFGFSLSIPLPFWNDNAGAVQAAEAKVQRRQQETIALVENVKNQAQGATEEMKQWKLLDQQIARELLPLAQEQVKLATKSYQQGQGEIQSIFRARAQVRQLSLSQLDARREYHLARVRYEASVAAQH